MTIPTMKRMFVETLKQESGLFTSYDDSKEKTVVLYAEGDNLEEITVFVTFSTFDNGSSMATLNCYDLPNFSKNLMAGYKACNKLNDDELDKYYIDEDGDAVASAVIHFDTYGFTTGFEPGHVMIAAISLALGVDEAYPILEQASW